MIDLNAIKRIREARELTQEQVANAVGMTQQAVAKWEAGGSLPRADKLPILAKILNCTVDELLRTEPENGVGA